MPLSRRTLRIAAIVLGITILIWLSLEGRDERVALLLAGLLSLLGAAGTLNRLQKPPGVIWMPVLGAVFGFLVPLLAAFLMLLKVGMHGHSLPDFSFAQISAVLKLVPVWAGVGALLGLAAAWWGAIRR